MTRVPPPSPVAASRSTGSGATVVVANPPVGFARLPVGSRLVGQVTATTPSGQITIETPFGPLAARASAALVKGAELHMVLQAVAPRLQLRIAAMGREPQSPSAPTPHNASPSAAVGRGQGDMPAPPATAGPPSSSLAVGDTVAATVLKSLGGIAAGATPNAPSATTGASIPGYGAGSASMLQGHGDVQGAPRFNVRIVQPGTVPDGALAQKATGDALVPGRVLEAVVTGIRVAGHVVVRTEAGPLVLASNANLQMGRALTLQILNAAALPPLPSMSAAASGDVGTAAVLSETRAMANLGEALDALREVNPVIAARVADTVLPQATNSLAARILFLLTALRGGDVRSWLGESAVRSLRWARPGLSARLAEDFPRLERVTDERATESWRILQIPFVAEDELQPVRLFTKHRRQDTNPDSSEDSEGSRFVVDVKLSRLGHLQLDGLVRDGGRRLDLIIRSEQPLLAAIQDHIRMIFIEAGQVTGLQGGIGFQAQPAGFVEVTAAEHPRLPAGVLV